MIGYIRTRDRYIHQYLTSKLNNIAIKGKIYFFSLEFLHGSEKFLLLQKHCFLEGNFFILLIHPLDNAVILQLEGNRSPVRCKIFFAIKILNDIFQQTCSVTQVTEQNASEVTDKITQIS